MKPGNMRHLVQYIGLLCQRTIVWYVMGWLSSRSKNACETFKVNFVAAERTCLCAEIFFLSKQ